MVERLVSARVSRRIALLILIAGCLVFAAGCRQSEPTSDLEAPTAAQASPEAAIDPQVVQRAEQAFAAKLESLWRAAQDTEENFPGGIAAFMLADGHVFVHAVGFSDVERQVPMTIDLRMPSGSIGKTYVAAVALQLAQQGDLDLDRPISDWLGEEPWFDRVPNAADLTLRILLTHTGGLIDHAFASEAFAEWAKSNIARGEQDLYLEPRQIVEFILDTEPLFPAGEGYSYTDTGYILAGIAIEEATGKAYYDHLRELFLIPLGLEYTLPADRRDLPDLAQGYAHESSEFFGTPLEIVEDGVMAIHPLTEWTGGGLVNNPQDLVRWGMALYEGRAISGDYLDQLLAIGHVQDPAAHPRDGYGLGVFIREVDGELMYGHSGFYPGYNSRLLYIPSQHLAVALQINSDKSSVGEHTGALAAVVVEALAGEAKP